MDLLNIGIRASKQTTPVTASMSFEITTTTPNEDANIPVTETGTYNFIVNWGDGSPEQTIVAWDDPNCIHTYADAGAYIVVIRGTCTQLGFSGALNPNHLTSLIEFVGDIGLTYFDCINCPNLTTIPSTFTNLKLLTAVSFSTSGIVTIPSGIFDEAIEITDFSNVFSFCSITTIPNDLFKYNVKAVNFNSAFSDCLLLVSVPANLFRYNINAIDFTWVFASCEKLQLNANIFYADGEQGTRFYNQSPIFQQSFFRNDFSGVQGIAPDLWNCDYGSGAPIQVDGACFSGAGNSNISLDNYDNIPNDWKID